METKSPITARPHRTPGQSVEEERNRILSEVVDQWLLMALVMVVFAALEWFRWARDIKPEPGLFTAFAIAVCAVATWRVWRVIPKLRELKLARDGELAVGQFLEELRSHGYRVFHDLVGESFNVDHVIIGPAGIFTIETKTWSKPVKGPAEINFDGKSIKRNGLEPDRNPVIQARAQASWIRNLLDESFGSSPYVKPVVLFPGWYVVNERQSFDGVWVLEPKAFKKFVVKEPIRVSESDVNLLAHHLSLHIRAQARD
jgi:hypothetical protein